MVVKCTTSIQQQYLRGNSSSLYAHKHLALKKINHLKNIIVHNLHKFPPPGINSVMVMVWHVVLWILLFAVFLGCHDLPLLAVSSFSTVNVGIRRPSNVGVVSRRSDRNAGVRFLSSSSTTPASPPPGDVPDGADLTALLAVAERAARQAGQLIRDHAGGAAISDTKANSKDLLTRIDSLCEHRIRETVTAAFPTHTFLGEEMVAPGREASAAALDEILAQSHDTYLWIVDPIDGTLVSVAASVVVSW